MTKRRSTKSALLSSVLALFLCITMLMGTTFAWFTDSVTSENNIIKSGNLDITLEYWDGDSWEDVQDATDVLTGNLWEPGYVDIAYLRMKNAGSLALKYQLSVNIVSETEGKNQAGNSFKLSDYIYYNVVEGVDGENGAYATREAAMEKATEETLISAGYTKNGTLAAESAYVYLAMIVHMPTTVNNDANHNGIDVPQINLGINLLATQMAAEKDSFDETYDADAWMPEMLVYDAADLQAALANGGTVTLADDVDLTESITIPAAPATFAMRAIPAATVLNLNGKTLSGELSGALLVNEGNLVIKNGTIKNTAVNGGATINNKGALTLAAGANIVGAPIAADAGYPAYCITNAGTLTVEEGANVSADRGCLFLSGTGETVINGGNFTNNDISVIIGERAFTSHVVVVGYGANNKLTINDGTFKHFHTKTSGGVVINNWSAVTVDVNGGNFSGGNYFGKWDNLSDYGYGSTSTPFSVKGGTFTGMDEKFIAAGYGMVTNEDGTFTVKTEGAIFADTLAKGGEVTLDKNLEITEPIVIPENIEATLNLNGKTLTGTAHKSVGAVLKNNGVLTITGGTISSTAPNGGSAIVNNGTLHVENATLNGASNADGSWPSYTVNNTGVMTLTDCKVTSVHGAICSYGEGAVLTLNNAELDMSGIPGFTSHALYTYSGGKIIVNGGKIANHADDQNATGASVINGAVIINDGTFSGRIENYYGTPVIKGGTFTVDPSRFLAAGYEVVKDDATGTWTVKVTKVADSAALNNAIASGEKVQLTDDVTFNSSITNDATINLAGNTFEATGTINLSNNADLTMTGGNYEVNGTYGHVDVRPSTTDGSKLVFEDVDFSFNKLNRTNGPSTNRLGTVVEVCATAVGAKTVIVFKNCTFDNAQVLFEGLSGTIGEFEATFENCTFNALTSSAPIYVQNYVKGTINVKNCTFNLSCTSSTASAISVSPSSSTEVTVNAENNTINAQVATPYTYDAEKGETEVHNVKVNGTPANIKFISAYANTTVNEIGTVKTGIAQ